MTSEAQKRATAKWDKENMKVFSCKIRKEKAEELRIYAEKQELTINKFAILAMEYCKSNNILLNTDK